jgi:hypothetical protein
MPAVELTRLRSQINTLIASFDNPAVFCSGISGLLDQYSNRAYRPGQTVQVQALLPSYRVPPLITHQLEQELSRTCREQPVYALGVVEALWRDTFVETRTLAAVLLGAIPASHAASVVQKLREWATPKENFRMLQALFQNGTITLRSAAPQLLFTLFGEWLASREPDVQALGVQALVPLVTDGSFENLPPVYRLLGPLVQNVPPALNTELSEVLLALSRRSPTETAYFLRQALSIATGPATARLARKCLPLFGPQQQASLRAALQSARGS